MEISGLLLRVFPEINSSLEIVWLLTFKIYWNFFCIKLVACPQVPIYKIHKNTMIMGASYKGGSVSTNCYETCLVNHCSKKS